MALQDSFPGASNKVDSTELRKDLAGLIVRDSAGVPRGGIFPRHTGALITARSDMKVNVLAFEGISVRGGGPLFMANDGMDLSPLIPIPLANSQTSVIYFKQNESGSPYLDANDLPIIGIVSGSPSANPVKPSIAGIAGAEELGTVTVPFDATATNSNGVVVTPTHRFTALTGGTVLVRNKTERDNGFLWADKTTIDLIDSGTRQRYTIGDSWYPIGAHVAEYAVADFIIASGTVTSVPTPTLTPAKSTSIAADLFTPVAGGLTALKKGVYSVSFGLVLEFPANGRTFFDISSSSGANARTQVPVGEDSAAGAVGTFVAPAANSTLTFSVFLTGTTRIIKNQVIRVAYLGPVT